LETGFPFPAKSVFITFDDGYQNNYLYAFPELLKYGLRATFYVVTKYLVTNSPLDWGKRADTEEQDFLAWRPLNWEEISEMVEHGMEIASHSHTHPDFYKIDQERVIWELDEAKRTLSNHLDSFVKTFACPYGVWGKTAAKLKVLLRANGYSGAFLGKWGALKANTDPMDLPRIIIYGGDSLRVFKQKIDGAYDWVGCLHSM
jgi:peptidoglycan/xylan/chitin deacetylase (PgdA/CDA1 family)